MSGRGSRYPFTATQWQELEHQALIFKYMASGIPIPSDLILPIRRSFLLDSSPSTNPSLAFPHQLPMLGWGSYHLGGYGKKAEDPEPGRCRRTDGKKWRCSKDAYPDSKYCERHMHRGKNRSRKPVEMSLASLPTNHHHSPLYHPPPPPPLSISTPELFYTGYSSSSAKPPNTTHLHLDTGSYYTTENKDYYSTEYCRYAHGMRDVDEYSFFSEASGAARESSSCWPKLSTATTQQQHGYADYSNCTEDLLSKEESGKQQQHCFVLGADFKLEKPVKEDREKVPLRHFFDEWPQKSKESSPWIDLDEHSSSKTQLSISIPAMTSRYHNED